jgi:hypothetical protein
MSDTSKQEILNRLQEIMRTNEELKMIGCLEPTDKLWLSKKKYLIKSCTGGADVETELPCFEIHKAGIWPLNAATRMWYGQGREPILAHISAIVETIEKQTTYDFLYKRDIIPHYADIINKACNKIESVIAHQYTNFAEDIDDYVRRMKEASSKLMNGYNSAKGK